MKTLPVSCYFKTINNFKIIGFFTIIIISSQYVYQLESINYISNYALIASPVVYVVASSVAVEAAFLVAVVVVSLAALVLSSPSWTRERTLIVLLRSEAELERLPRGWQALESSGVGIKNGDIYVRTG